jgi:hypothetical protein
MAETVKVETNIDALDERVFITRLFNLVEELSEAGETLLRGFVPKGETEAMARAVSKTPTTMLSDVIESEIGIGRIESARIRDTSGESDPADYPLFRHSGTGIFGPKHEPIFAKHNLDPSKFGGGLGYMKFPWHGSILFRHSVKGSRPSPFMAETEAALRALLPAMIDTYKAAVKADLEARKAAYKLADE